jgi:hypothetical protein
MHPIGHLPDEKILLHDYRHASNFSFSFTPHCHTPWNGIEAEREVVHLPPPTQVEDPETETDIPELLISRFGKPQTQLHDEYLSHVFSAYTRFLTQHTLAATLPPRLEARLNAIYRRQTKLKRLYGSGYDTFNTSIKYSYHPIVSRRFGKPFDGIDDAMMREASALAARALAAGRVMEGFRFDVEEAIGLYAGAMRELGGGVTGGEWRDVEKERKRMERDRETCRQAFMADSLAASRDESVQPAL